jgi:GDP-mannose 6-dehydrogenase
MKVAVLGLGYVGTVSAACLARDGHSVLGVDVNEAKVSALESGESPVLEPGLGELVRAGRSAGLLRAATSLEGRAGDIEVFLLAVGTPSASNGSTDLSHLLRAVSDLGAVLKPGSGFPVVTVRSTVPPGTMKGRVLPLLEERSGRKVGVDLGVAMNPEFLREGTSIQDYDSAPFDLCGATDERSAKQVQSLYASRKRPFQVTTLETAEMVKYVNNAFHALKVTFANEIGRLAKSKGIDSLEVMRMLCEDKRLNISTAYLRPGMAFGGSCLPKDLRALVYEANRSDVKTPLLSGVIESNEVHLSEAIRAVLVNGRPRTAVVGLSFKAGTDDLRESPMVRLVETLLGKGLSVKIFDRNVRLSTLVGANREYINREIPHISQLFVEDLKETLRDTDLVVVGTDDPEVDRIPEMLVEGQTLVDLAGRLARRGVPGTEGICW